MGNLNLSQAHLSPTKTVDPNAQPSRSPSLFPPNHPSNASSSPNYNQQAGPVANASQSEHQTYLPVNDPLQGLEGYYTCAPPATPSIQRPPTAIPIATNTTSRLRVPVNEPTALPPSNGPPCPQRQRNPSCTTPVATTSPHQSLHDTTSPTSSVPPPTPQPVNPTLLTLPSDEPFLSVFDNFIIYTPKNFKGSNRRARNNTDVGSSLRPSPLPTNAAKRKKPKASDLKEASMPPTPGVSHADLPPQPAHLAAQRRTRIKTCQPPPPAEQATSRQKRPRDEDDHEDGSSKRVRPVVVTPSVAEFKSRPEAVPKPASVLVSPPLCAAATPSVPREASTSTAPMPDADLQPVSQSISPSLPSPTVIPNDSRPLTEEECVAMNLIMNEIQRVKLSTCISLKPFVDIFVTCGCGEDKPKVGSIYGRPLCLDHYVEVIRAARTVGWPPSPDGRVHNLTRKSPKVFYDIKNLDAHLFSPERPIAQWFGHFGMYSRRNKGTGKMHYFVEFPVFLFWENGERIRDARLVNGYPPMDHRVWGERVDLVGYDEPTGLIATAGDTLSLHPGDVAEAGFGFVPVSEAPTDSAVPNILGSVGSSSATTETPASADIDVPTRGEKVEPQEFGPTPSLSGQTSESSTAVPSPQNSEDESKSVPLADPDSKRSDSSDEFDWKQFLCPEILASETEELTSNIGSVDPLGEITNGQWEQPLSSLGYLYDEPKFD
ncbi:hypothetical protein V5O48_009944 [Marasmius crinis-equi]|uniref:Uncharacterized protein n=1 Tax=Marasmius crinis-equi TaxID=585013 RepID=A0ABR3F9W7_9AGAR